jgi:thiol-disulfide isomerase/thioredoxin
MVKILDYENMNLDNFSEGVHVLLFYLTGCGPCEALYPKIENLSMNHPDANFFKIVFNSEEPNFVRLAERFNVLAYPKVVIIVNGSFITSIENGEELENSIDSILTHFHV